MISDRDKEIMRLLFEGEKTLQAIADQFEITRERVRQVGKKYGMKENVRLQKSKKRVAELERQRQEEREFWESERQTQIDRCVSLRKAGTPIREIAVLVYGTETKWRKVAQDLQRAGQTSRKSDLIDKCAKRDKKIYAAYVAGDTYAQMCEKFGVKQGNLARIIRSMKDKARKGA